jgi:CHAT domain
MRYEDFTLLLTGAREVEGANARLLTFHVQVPSAAGLAAIAEPIASRCDLGKVRRLSNADPARPPEPSDVLEAGSALGHALLPGAVLATVRQALARLRARGQGLRLRIFSDALHWVPWEYAILPPERGEATATDFLALMPDVSIVRDQACPLPDELFEARPPFRILGAAAHPKLAAQIDVKEERRLLEAALRDVRGVELQWVDGGARPAPSADLRPAQMFHFAGHGAFNRVTTAAGPTRHVALAEAQDGQPQEPGTGVLIFDDGSGGEDRVTAGELGVILRELGVRVAVLNACQSARRDTAHAWSSVAAALLHAGIHSVVAMQHAILDASAIGFSAAFYRALAAGDSLDGAAHRGRVAVFARGDGLGWGTPVLYLPEKLDGVVFRDAASPATGWPPPSGARIDFRIERQRHESFVGRAAVFARIAST